jgi:hypothetical protein
MDFYLRAALGFDPVAVAHGRNLNRQSAVATGKWRQRGREPPILEKPPVTVGHPPMKRVVPDQSLPRLLDAVSPQSKKRKVLGTHPNGG